MFVVCLLAESSLFSYVIVSNSKGGVDTFDAIIFLAQSAGGSGNSLASKL